MQDLSLKRLVLILIVLNVFIIGMWIGEKIATPVYAQNEILKNEIGKYQIACWSHWDRNKGENRLGYFLLKTTTGKVTQNDIK